MIAIFRSVLLGLALALVSGAVARAAGPHLIKVLVVHQDAPVEATVTVIDHEMAPPEHSTGVARKGVYTFPVWPDAKGKLCFSAYTKFSPVLRAAERCVAAPYPSSVTLELK